MCGVKGKTQEGFDGEPENGVASDEPSMVGEARAQGMGCALATPAVRGTGTLGTRAQAGTSSSFPAPLPVPPPIVHRTSPIPLMPQDLLTGRYQIREWALYIRRQGELGLSESFGYRP